jgi:dUTP pyrophosphatase
MGRTNYSIDVLARFAMKKLRPDAILPRFQTAGAAGMDLHYCGDKVQWLMPGQWGVLGCGFAMEMPIGCEAQIRPRSGLALKHGITVLNAPGTIDCDYRGEVGATLINHSNQPFKITPGDRIAQMVIAAYCMPTFAEVDELRESERGAGGFGSTGK